MRLIKRATIPVLSLILLAAAACGPPDDPELVAIAYVRASSTGDPDTAVDMLDIGSLTSRVEEQIVVLDSSGRETFLEDSIETLLWGLFTETRPGEYAFNATPAEIDGDSAHVEVTRTTPEQVTDTITVHLRRTDDGWRVSGSSLDRLVTFVVTRLQERY